MTTREQDCERAGDTCVRGPAARGAGAKRHPAAQIAALSSRGAVPVTSGANNACGTLKTGFPPAFQGRTI